jgi:hypothetical protein
VYASGLLVPVAFVQDPSDSRIQYVVEQAGRIRVVRSGVVLATDLLNLTGAITFGGEQGLLGMAFAPDAAVSGRFFVNFTSLAGDIVDDPSRGGTGALIIGDVGQNAWEEIDYEPPNLGGRNYGWRNREGAHPNIASPPPAHTPLIDPIHEYDRTLGQTIIGGYVYRGLALGFSHRGRYFYADFVQSRVWSLRIAVDSVCVPACAFDVREHTAELGGPATLGNVSSFGLDADGELYIVSHGLGMVLKVVPAGLAVTRLQLLNQPLMRGHGAGRRFRRRRKGGHHRLSSLDRRLVGPEVYFELHHVRQLWVGRTWRHPGPGRLRRRRKERHCDLSPVKLPVMDPAVQLELQYV